MNTAMNSATSAGMESMAIATGSAVECPICFKDVVVLATLDGCEHRICMDCVTSIAFNQHAKCKHCEDGVARCPFCRKQFSTVIDPGVDHLTFHAATLEFQMRGFWKVSAFCMGVANRITNDEDGNLYIPEYLHHMPGCSPLVRLWEIRYDHDTPGGLHWYKKKQRRFDEMNAALQPWLLLPIIYTKLIIALHIQRMVKEKLWDSHAMYTDEESVAERAEDQGDNPPESEGGRQQLFTSIDGFGAL